MSSSTTYLGLDVHKGTITVAVLPIGAAAPTHVDRLSSDLVKLRRYCERLATHGEIRASYEASGAGYVVQRAMTSWGFACEVIAPSLIPTKPGVQRKNDKGDATQLARLYRAGELTVVRVPTEAEERVRDVVYVRPFPDAGSGRWQVSRNGWIRSRLGARRPRVALSRWERFDGLGGGAARRRLHTRRAADDLSGHRPHLKQHGALAACA